MTAPLWVFRVASRPEVGGGHVSRCLTLARAMAGRVSVRFVLDPEGADWTSRIMASGFEVGAEGDAWTGHAEGVILDTYEVSRTTLQHWRQQAARLVAIVDTECPLAGVDISIMQWRLACNEAGAGVLWGLRHALVPRQFAEIADAVWPELPQHVLVSFGLRDSVNATGLIISALENLATEWQPEVTIVAGARAPHLEAVRKAVDRLGSRGGLVVEADSMIPLLASCDFAIGAGGISAAERAAAGRPSATLALNAHQRMVAQALSSCGATLDLGGVESADPETLAAALLSLAKDREGRMRMAAAARRAVDGQGARRVADGILGWQS